MKIEDLKLDNNKMYFLSPCGMGDTLILCGFLKALQEKYNSEIVLLIKASHKLIVDLCNISSYHVVDFNNNLETLSAMSNKCPYPRKGEIYVAHEGYHYECLDATKRNCGGDMGFMSWYRHFLKLPESTICDIPHYHLTLSAELAKKVKDIAPLEKIILFSPEAVSMEPISKDKWTSLAEKLRKDGYIIISSVMREENTIDGTIFLPMNNKEALELAYNCHSVYALRSGFSDLCVHLGTKLNVFYPSYELFSIYNMKEMFIRNDIKEEIVPNIEKTPSNRTSIYLFGIPIITITHGRNKDCISVLGIRVLKLKKF